MNRNIKKVIKVKLTFTEPVLGTLPNNESLYSEFIASKAPDADKYEEELDSFDVNDAIQKGMTVFLRDDEGRPCLWDYQIRGFFKGACGFLKRSPGSVSSKCKAFKKEIDGGVFVYPRKVFFENVREIGECQRPLRASTAQGERVALASSEMIPAGATLTFEIGLTNAANDDLVYEWLDYGELNGIGQWRNSGMGRFTWEEVGDNDD